MNWRKLIRLIFGGGAPIVVPFPPQPTPQPTPQPRPAVKVVPNSEFIDMMNRFRATYGVAPLQESKPADDAADWQSDYQYEIGKMQHEGPPGMEDEGARLRHFGEKDWTAAAENVAMAETYAEAMRQWIASPKHRQNLLNPVYKYAGASITPPSDRGRYATQVFHN